MRLICLAMVVAPMMAQADEVSWRFAWNGNGGYAVRGGMSYETTAIDGPLVTGSDVSCFFIEGTRNGETIGQWGLALLNEETWWRLYFDPVAEAFLVEGMGVDMPQAWNMDGFGTSCGAGGFGFNIGSAAQDICIDEQLIVESQVDPYTPLSAVRDDALTFPSYACEGPSLLSRLELD